VGLSCNREAVANGNIIVSAERQKNGGFSSNS